MTLDNNRGSERRSSPRLEVEAILHGVLVEGNLRLILRDLGFGGFAVESPIAFTVASQHEFRFTTETGLVVSTLAEAIYSRPLGPRDGMIHYVTGFRFGQEGAVTDQAIQIIIDAAVAPLSFS